MMKILFLITLSVLILVVVYEIIKRKKENSRTELLIKYLTSVQDNPEIPQFSEMEEGNSGILQSEIYKVVTLLRESYSSETRQKKYMADMFLDISHQFKTPLTAISVMTELLETPELSDEKRMEYAAGISKQTAGLTWMIKNILVLSQLEAGVIELKRESVPVPELISSIRDTFEIMAEIKEIQFDISCPEEISLICDRQWTAEALSNIVKNALEHTPAGGKVKITASQDNFATHIHIRDNGEGISPEHLPHIFERFYRASSASDSVGIGLALSRQIIMNQNGVIEVTSILNEGTDFYIRFYSD